MSAEKITLVLKGIKPTPLNRLYTPLCKWVGKCLASTILSKEAKLTKKHIQNSVMAQKMSKRLEGDICFYMDIDVKNVKSPDIDALLKQLFDALEGLCYKNDRQILDLRVRKHLNQGEDKITILIEEIE